MKKKREELHEKFNQQKERAKLFFENSCKTIKEEARKDGAPVPKKGCKQKRMFTAAGQEFYQIQPLTRMG